MYEIETAKCWARKCRHYLGFKALGDGPEEREVNYCVAFPDGIPDEIAFGDNKHDKPLPTQTNRLVYERRPRGTTLAGGVMK